MSFGSGLLELEILGRLESEQACQQQVGETLDTCIQVAHGAVVVTPRELDIGLDRADVVLQLQETLVCLQLRVGFLQRSALTRSRVFFSKFAYWLTASTSFGIRS